MQVQPGPLRAEKADLTRTALEKVLTRHFFHMHSHSFFPLFFFSSFLSSCCPISPSLTSKCYLCKKWWSFSCPCSLLPGGTCSFLELTVSTISFNRKKETEIFYIKHGALPFAPPCAPALHCLLFGLFCVLLLLLLSTFLHFQIELTNCFRHLLNTTVKHPNMYIKEPMLCSESGPAAGWND